MLYHGDAPVINAAALISSGHRPRRCDKSRGTMRNRLFLIAVQKHDATLFKDTSD